MLETARVGQGEREILGGEGSQGEAVKRGLRAGRGNLLGWGETCQLGLEEREREGAYSGAQVGRAIACPARCLQLLRCG